MNTMAIPAAGRRALTPLSLLPEGEPALIERLDGRPEAMLHLLELGLFPGEVVRVLRSAPGGDPMELEVMGYRLAIRRAEAGVIMVRPREAVQDAG